MIVLHRREVNRVQIEYDMKVPRAPDRRLALSLASEWQMLMSDRSPELKSIK